jgi:drug/metabolite transporter (DMT)-like permease
MHLKRWLTGLIALPLLVFFIYRGGWLFSLLVAAGSLLGLYEYFRIVLQPTEKIISAPTLIAAVTGLLLWVGGNGAVNWAEQRIDSGLAALIVGSMPIWVALMESIWDRRLPSLLLTASLAIGFGGLVVLSFPMLRDGVSADLLGVVAVIFAAVSWGFGSIIVNRRPLRLDPVVVSSWQQLIGGVGFALLAVAVAEPAPTPTTEAWLAWAYLVVFGSLLAYTSFVYALKLLPTTVVMTYAYVNPAIAVLLGWLILSEPITGYTLGGMALIIAGVYGVFRDKGRRSSN